VVGSREDITSSRGHQKEQGNCMPSGCTYNIGTFVSEVTCAVDFYSAVTNSLYFLSYLIHLVDGHLEKDV